MKAVLISIQPKWCELIASRKKTVEVRKSRPNMDVPFKCYIYCTSSNVHECLLQNESGAKLIHAINYKTAIPVGGYVGNGKVIGEFVCDGIDRMVHSGTCNNDIRLRIVDKHLNYKEIDYAYLDACKLSYSDLDRYSGGRDVYGWHISELVIYDEPKELSEFNHCGRNYHFNPPITRPPQSWCYVEVLYG